MNNNQSATTFRRKVSVNYMQNYLDSLKEGFGFNIMDALAKTFKAKGLDESNADLYNKIVKFSNILADREEENTKLAEKAASAAQDTASTAVDNAKSGAEAAGKAAESTGKQATKAAKSYKPLWYTAGALAVAGGVYAFVKNRHPKPVKKDEAKTPQDNTKKVSA